MNIKGMWYHTFMNTEDTKDTKICVIHEICVPHKKIALVRSLESNYWCPVKLKSPNKKLG
jgi:hypothetical protein